ncbi:MAG TPA: GspE/PulE family protein, partial [Candidatus Paceibacterota bacterium]|nr:GspE/PulE family protein [Candidatus Paceibacterota bacterium]
IITRIKILSNLRTDEHQAAQDGRFRVQVGDAPIDVRVSITPTYYGENAVLRLLAQQAEEFTLESLGFSEENKAKIRDAVRKPHGMILATGPTGSGKTTTLYTLLKQLNTKTVSIITIEDPVEYAVEGVSQIQINPRSGLTFGSGLRSILRQDPNIIMVGEIRDSETASIAVNTALTGHLILSTLHTSDAATTLPRLLDMGVDPYLVASTVNVAIGQRLVRRICGHCKEAYALTPAQAESLASQLFPGQLADMPQFYRGRGCEECDGTGYSGRIGIHEVMVLGPEIREAILKKVSAANLREIAKKNGMTPLFADGFMKAEAGKTTIEEVLRTVRE